MGSSTTYAVNVKYTLQDRASAGIKGMGETVSKVANGVFSLKNALLAAGSVAIFHKAKTALIDFNQEMFDLKNSMRTVMEMNMHLPIQKAAIEADKLFLRFQEIAKTSPLMTSDFMEMAQALAPVISTAGGGVGKLQRMTEGALKASLAYGIRPDQMAMDIQEMLNGAVRLTSRTALPLVAATGLDRHAFNAKPMAERAKLTEDVIFSRSVLDASNRAAHSLKGETSTIKDNLQIAFGEAGKPLMAQLTKDFARINEWIRDNPKKIEDWTKSFATALTTAFNAFKDIGEWFIKHGSTLLSMGKAFLVYKATAMAAGMLPGLVKSGAGFLNSRRERYREGYSSAGYRGDSWDSNGNYVAGRGGSIKDGLLAALGLDGVAGWLRDRRAGWRQGRGWGYHDGAPDGSNDSYGMFGRKGTIGEGLAGAFKGVSFNMASLIPSLATATTLISAFGAAVSLATSFLSDNNSIEEQNKRNRENALSLEQAIGDYPALRARRDTLNTMMGPDGMFRNGSSELKQRLLNERNSINSQLYDPEKIGLILRKLDEDSTSHGGLSLKNMALDDTGLLSKKILAWLPQTADTDHMKENTEIMKKIGAFFDTFQNIPADQRRLALQYAFPAQFGTPNPMPEVAEGWGGNPTKPEINVTIQKVEVASEDPDRFVYDLVNMAEQATKHSTQSQHIIPGGF